MLETRTKTWCYNPGTGPEVVEVITTPQGYEGEQQSDVDARHAADVAAQMLETPRNC